MWRRDSLLFVALVVPPGRPAIDIRGFHLVESQEAKRLLEVDARAARVYKPEDVTALDDLNARVWGEAPKPYIISGRVGVLHSQREDFLIHGASQVISPDGYLFKTDNLGFDAARRELSTDDTVEAQPAEKTGNSYLKLTGRGLLIDVRQNAYNILKNVRAEQHMATDNFLTIKSNQALISPQAHTAVFQGAVSVRSPNLDMKGGRLSISFSNANASGSAAESTAGANKSTATVVSPGASAGAGPGATPGAPAGRPDRLVLDTPRKGLPGRIEAQVPGLKLKARTLTVHLGVGGGVDRTEANGRTEGVTGEGIRLKAEELVSEQIDATRSRITLNRNVEIVLTDERVATCQRAEYFPATGDIVLEKVASVKRGQQVLEGERIRFSTRGSEIVVENARGQMDRSALRPQK